MSVWHETQIELTIDAIDGIIDEYGTTAELIIIRKIIGKAWVAVTDLPDNAQQSFELLIQSKALLMEAEKLVEKEKQQVPAHQERAWRILRNKIKNAQIAIAEELQAK